MAKKVDIANIAQIRQKTGLNQGDFWKRYGVTQSGGSRYESGRRLSRPLALLVKLHLSGVITDEELAKAAKS